MDIQREDSVKCDGADEKKKIHVVELIKRAQNGSEEAFSELKAIYRPLIEGRISKNTLYEMTSQDVEDLRQEAIVQFCNAICNFDTSVDGVEFGLYAKICVENGLVSFIRAYKSRQKKSVYSIDGEIEQISVYNDPAQDLIDKERLTSLVGLIQASLSEYESRVWWLYVSGMSVSDIAKRLGVSDPKSVTNAIYRIRKKLRSRISDSK